ncbi:MAG: hypothetical protein M3Q42_09285 [Pseudomonadota bacterium]|nr:hypothetical protein [Pseudomonadota bacterium]
MPLLSRALPGKCATLVRGIALGFVFASYSVPAVASGPVQSSSGSFAIDAAPAVTRNAKLANFHGESASTEVRHVANWVVHSGDNAGMPYMLVDKVNARVFVFDADGDLQGVQPALLGMVRGDSSSEGIGELKLAAIRPQDRTTPAGRFVASLDRDLRGREILWIDYDDALALHRVAKGQPSERRAQRLESATSDDNRISYGCINVPVSFYEEVVSPAFTSSGGIVYILPEMSTAREFFGSYDIPADITVQR